MTFKEFFNYIYPTIMDNDLVFEVLINFAKDQKETITCKVIHYPTNSLLSEVVPIVHLFHHYDNVTIVEYDWYDWQDMLVIFVE